MVLQPHLLKCPVGCSTQIIPLQFSALAPAQLPTNSADEPKNKPWIGLALDRDTREIVGVYVGSRNVKGAKALWDSLPSVYRQCAAGYTDFWAAYGGIFPSKRHHAVGKETGQTNHVERLNNTFRQRISRLVR